MAPAKRSLMSDQELAAMVGPKGGMVKYDTMLTERKLKNSDRAWEMLDENILNALQVVIDGLTSPDRYFKFRCAELLIRKVLPDKKEKQESPERSNSIHFNITDKRSAVLTIVNMLDEMSMDDIKKQVEDGSTKVFEPNPGPEGTEEAGLEEQTETDNGTE